VEELLRRAYRSFDARDVDALLADMVDDVDWPDVAAGARLRGHAPVRRYWEAQFETTDPRVEPLAFDVDRRGRWVVTVHQRVGDRELEVEHVYSFRDGKVARMDVRPLVACTWRGTFTNVEVNALHAEAFETRLYDESEWNWQALVAGHSLGWVVARDGDRLVGFVNVVWDGLVHAWLQDTMVAATHRHQAVGERLVDEAVAGARSAGCEWMHVDFDDDLRPFYIDACGFTPTSAGLLALDLPSDDG
jgi:GNAT superfamily N-acetyltransferase